MATVIHPAEILPLRLYLRVRGPWLRSIIDHKKTRRVPLGPHATVLFESRETVLFQIHEILRVETPRTDERVRREIVEYAPLVPDPRGLTATVMIEGGSPAWAGQTSRALGGESGALFLRIGQRRIDAQVIVPASEPECPVHYMRFPVPAGVAEELLEPALAVEIGLQVDGQITTSPLPIATRRELSATLGGLVPELPIIWQLAWRGSRDAGASGMQTH